MSTRHPSNDILQIQSYHKNVFNFLLKQATDEKLDEYVSSQAIQRDDVSSFHSLNCDLTGTRIIYPMVDYDGYSYERYAIRNWLKKNETTPCSKKKIDFNELVPNRTLEAVSNEVERAKHMRKERCDKKRKRLCDADSNDHDLLLKTNSSFGPYFMSTQEIESFMLQPIIAMPELNNKSFDLMPSLNCPIMLELMQDPWVDPDGISYEKCAIMRWVERNETHPTTRNHMTIDMLRPNRALKAVIQQLVNDRRIWMQGHMYLAQNSLEHIDAEPCAKDLFESNFSTIRQYDLTINEDEPTMTNVLVRHRSVRTVDLSHESHESHEASNTRDRITQGLIRGTHSIHMRDRLWVNGIHIPSENSYYNDLHDGDSEDLHDRDSDDETEIGDDIREHETWYVSDVQNASSVPQEEGRDYVTAAPFANQIEERGDIVGEEEARNYVQVEPLLNQVEYQVEEMGDTFGNYEPPTELREEEAKDDVMLVPAPPIENLTDIDVEQIYERRRKLLIERVLEVKALLGM